MKKQGRNYVPYASRDLQIQIRIDALVRMHGGKYPLSWYEGLSDRQITGMYYGEVKRCARAMTMQ